MADFNADTKKEIANAYFGEGVHKVTITGVKADTTADGKEFFQFDLSGENGEEGDARIYWTEKAQPYSFNTVRQIFVHNTVEANKDKIRATVDATNNTTELLKLCQSLIGKQAWYKVEKTAATYINAQGETKNSYNRNLYGFEPKAPVVTADDLISKSTPVDSAEIPFE